MGDNNFNIKDDIDFDFSKKNQEKINEYRKILEILDQIEISTYHKLTNNYKYLLTLSKLYKNILTYYQIIAQNLLVKSS